MLNAEAATEFDKLPTQIVGAIAGDDEVKALRSIQKYSRGTQEHIVSFRRADVAYCPDENDVIRKRELGAKRAISAGAKDFDVYAIRYDGALGFGQAQSRCEVLFEVFGNEYYSPFFIYARIM